MVLVKFLSFYLGIWRFLLPNRCTSCTRGSLIMISMEGDHIDLFCLRNLFPHFRPCDDKLGISCFQIFKQSRVNEWIILSWRYFKCQNENTQSKKYKSVHCLDQQLSPLHNPQLFLQFVFIHIVLLPELHSSNKAQDGHLTSVSLQSAQQGMMHIGGL